MVMLKSHHEQDKSCKAPPMSSLGSLTHSVDVLVIVTEYAPPPPRLQGLEYLNLSDRREMQI